MPIIVSVEAKKVWKRLRLVLVFEWKIFLKWLSTFSKNSYEFFFFFEKDKKNITFTFFPTFDINIIFE